MVNKKIASSNRNYLNMERSEIYMGSLQRGAHLKVRMCLAQKLRMYGERKVVEFLKYVIFERINLRKKILP